LDDPITIATASLTPMRRWRYQTALQVARMLNPPAREGRRPGELATGTEIPRQRDVGDKRGDLG
jgi:hypothetical protein